MGYYDEVSTQLKAGVGAQVAGIAGNGSANAEAGVSPSVSALDTGMKAAMAMGGLVDGAMEAALLPVLGALGMKGMACLPISKQLDPVIGIDVHLVTIPPSPVVPMPNDNTISGRQMPAQESPVQEPTLSWRRSRSRGFPYLSRPLRRIAASNPSLRPRIFV